MCKNDAQCYADKQDDRHTLFSCVCDEFHAGRYCEQGYCAH